MRHLLPILSPSFVPPNEKNNIITKVCKNHDYYLPFRQHAPSLSNARHKIYTDIDRLTSDDGVGLFNILAFRGVFFGSPFAQSDRYRWFNSLDDWKHFQDTGKKEANKHKGEEYYVKKNCYGQAQTGRKLSLLSSYWERRGQWKDMFNKPENLTVKKVFRWLTSRITDEENNSSNSSKLFSNIGSLTSLLICGDLVEAGILPMPSASDWAKSIIKMGKGSKEGMKLCGLVRESCSDEEFCAAFTLLDQALQRELKEEEKKVMGYNIIMLEHALCKIKRLGVELF